MRNKQAVFSLTADQCQRFKHFLNNAVSLRDTELQVWESFLDKALKSAFLRCFFPVDIFKLMYFLIFLTRTSGRCFKQIERARQVFWVVCLSLDKYTIIALGLVCCSYYLHLQCLNVKTADNQLLLISVFLWKQTVCLVFKVYINQLFFFFLTATVVGPNQNTITCNRDFIFYTARCRWSEMLYIQENPAWLNGAVAYC